MIKTSCIKIEKTHGEEAIVAARKLGLCDSGWRVEREQDYLYIPLIREPRETELKELERNLPHFEVQQREFLELVEHPPKLVDLLSGELPPHLLASLPHSIDFVGDIAIVEVPPELENFKAAVGRAILSTHKPLSTVLAKASAVNGEYRLRQYETIAGVPKTTTVHREYGCIFHVDLAKAYYSPRLSYEHNRVASLVGESETVLDMFSGVGPFSILIAKRHRNVHVYGAEVNPEAFKLLKKNIVVNRVETKVTPLLGDVRKIVRDRLKGRANRVVMNLPEKAIEYIDSASEAIEPEGGIIHYYEFANTSEPLETARIRFTEAVKQTNREVEKILHSRIVRGVAPFTWQIVLDAKII